MFGNRIKNCSILPNASSAEAIETSVGECVVVVSAVELHEKENLNILLN